MPDSYGIFTHEESERILIKHEGILALLPEAFSRDRLVLDLGCGRGHACEHLKNHGFEVFGFEGTPLSENESVGVPIFTVNLIQPWWRVLPQGQVLCIEVGEHIPPSCESVMFDNICRLTAPGCVSLISWAVEGQEGCGHINCRNNDYVIQQMEVRGLIFQEGRTAELRQRFNDIYHHSLMLFLRECN